MERISTGSFDFNDWLGGGYETEVITMLAGPPGSGKTNFCILCACSQSKKGNKVFLIDTEGGFSVERVKQIVGEESYNKVLENLFLFSPVNFEEQKKTFDLLLDKIKKEHTGLIIVDGMSMLYRLEMGEANQSESDLKIRNANRDIAKQMRILSEISRKQKIPILITNQVYSGFVSEEDWRKGVKGNVNIVGGDLFKYWSKCIIELKNENGKRKAVLLKHRSMKPKEFSFEIKNEGIFKKGWGLI